MNGKSWKEDVTEVVLILDVTEMVSEQVAMIIP